MPRRVRLQGAGLLAAAGLQALSGCAPRTVAPETFARDRLEVRCCTRTETPVRVTYLGVGGLLIRWGDEALLTAPFFSNPSMVRTGLAPIAADPERIDAHLPDVSDVSAILVGHGHYDHLMDVPWIARNRAPGARIYGNATTAAQLAPFGLGTLPDGRSRVVDLSGAARRDGEPGRWIAVSDGIRIMPLVSDHAPHLAGLTLYGGIRRRAMDREPRSAEEWLDGETLAFLIDLVEPDGTVAMRIYYQDAVAAAPYGLAPPLADGVGVDLAAVVPATYAEVDWHPEALLADLRPGHVLLIHWEDFFRPPDTSPEPVPFTLLGDFLDRMGRALSADTSYSVPVPGTELIFR